MLNVIDKFWTYDFYIYYWHFFLAVSTAKYFCYMLWVLFYLHILDKQSKLIAFLNASWNLSFFILDYI